MAVTGKNTLELIIAARDRTRGAFTKVGAQMKGLEKASSKITGAFKKAAKAGVLIGGAAVVGAVVASAKAFMDFEDAMANVRKTTGMTKDEISILGDAIQDMALRIPLAQNELADIAAVAGQLGISGKENILAFTEDVAKMSTAFDMPAEAAAIAMAKMANIYDIPIEKVSSLGSAINALGNTTAAQESAIMDFAMSLGSSAKMLGFNETESVAMGASLISMGMDASAAGTRLNSAFTQMGKNVTEIAAFLGMTEAEFKAAFGEDPMNMLMQVTEKLSLIEDPLERNTVAAETFGLIGAKAINNLGANIDGLKTNLATAATEFEKNTSLSEEFAAKTDTLKARFTLLKNSLTDMFIDMGAGMAPALTSIIEKIREIMPAVKEAAMELGAGFSEMFESISRQAGPALEPLIAALKEAGEKMSAGMDFKTIADDIGVFIGVGLKPLIEAFTWLIEKMGPLWNLLNTGAAAFHTLANALKTEEGKLDDILDATEGVTKAKLDLFNINEKLRGNVETLADALEKAGGWTTALADLEADAKVKTDALAVARLAASEAIAVHGANSDIAKTAIENVKIAEEAATSATNSFNTAVGDAAGVLIAEGVATEGLEKAQLEFIASTETATTKQGELQTAVGLLETELIEAKVAPFDLGTAFTNFGKLVATVFLELPLKIAESILKVQETIAGGLEKIGLGGFAEKFEGSMEVIREKIATIRETLEISIEDPLSEDIPKASEEMEEAVTGAVEAIVSSATRVKEGVEKVDSAFKKAEKAATDTGKAGETAFEQVEITVDEVSGKITVLTDDLGDTAATFKKNEDAAKTLLELDWDVFSKLGADLPNINSGIGDMTNAFEGLEFVLEENLENLESVKASVENIADMTAPFTDAGFLNGIKSIGTFAGALQDAGSAINTFVNLQDISIDGCIRFSGHVHDMVSALRILEDQMEDLVPAFGDMDSLITDISDAFLYSGGKVDIFISDFDKQMDGAYSKMEEAGVPFGDFKKLVDDAFDTGSFEYWYEGLWWDTQKVDDLGDAIGWMDSAITSSNDSMGEFKTKADAWKDIDFRYTFEQQVAFPLQEWIRTNYGVIVSTEEMYELMGKPPEEQKIWLDELMHSETALTFQMDKQTNALKAQNEQLAKITTALEPYLNFMRTLNELAALSTLSTEELNNGLNSIRDTLVNLGSALAGFDLQTAMEALFGSGEAEGSAKNFMDTMSAFEAKFNMLTGYIDRLSGSLMILVDAFTALEEINKSVLSNQVKLEGVFKGMVDVMANFSKAMDESGFGEALAKGMDAMLESAKPLILYFRNNSAAVTEFNDAFSLFATTLKNIIEISEDLAKTVRNAGDETVVSSEEIAKAMEKIPYQLGQIALFLETDIWKLVVDGLRLADDAFSEFEDTIADTDFGAIVTTFRDLLDIMSGLKKIFSETEEQVVISSAEMEKAMEKIPAQLGQIAVFLDTDILRVVVDGLSLADDAFSEFEDTLDNADVGLVVRTFSDLLDMMSNLKTTFVDLEEQVIISSAEMVRATEKIPGQLGEITKFLGTTMWKLIVDGMELANNAFTKFEKSLDESTPGVKAATDTFSSLMSMVTSLADAFESVKEMSVTTSRDMEKAMENINVFIIRFTEALRLNLDALVDALIDLDIEWSIHAKAMEKIMPSYKSASSDIGTLIGSFTSLANALKSLAETGTITATQFSTGFGALIDSIGNFAASLKTNVGPLIGSLQSLREVWMQNEAALVPLMQDFVVISKNFASMAINANRMVGAFADLAANSGSLEAGFKTLILFIKEVVQNTKEFYTPEAAAQLAGFIEDVGKVISSFVSLDTQIASAMNDIKSKISSAVNAIETTLLSLSNLNGSMFNSGANLIGSFISGIESMQSVLEAAMTSIANIIKAYLGVASDTESGPLSNLTQWPENLVKTFANGINAEMKSIDIALGRMVAPAVVSGGGGNVSNITLNINQKIDSKATADYAIKELERSLKAHLVL